MGDVRRMARQAGAWDGDERQYDPVPTQEQVAKAGVLFACLALAALVWLAAVLS